MKLFAFVLIPAGFVLYVLLLSGNQTVQQWGVKLASLRVNIYESVRLKIYVTLPWLIFFLTLCMWYFQYQKVLSKPTVPSDQAISILSAPYIPQYDLPRKFKRERDFWILFCNLLLWFFIARFSNLLTKHWGKITAMKRASDIEAAPLQHREVVETFPVQTKEERVSEVPAEPKVKKREVKEFFSADVQNQLEKLENDSSTRSAFPEAENHSSGEDQESSSDSKVDLMSVQEDPGEAQEEATSTYPRGKSVSFNKEEATAPTEAMDISTELTSNSNDRSNIRRRLTVS